MAFVALAFAGDEIAEDKSLVKNRMNGRIGEELIEHVAIAAPRCAEADQDVLMLGGGLAFELSQNLVRAGSRMRSSGLGKCGRCNVGNVYVCKDGLVFSYAQMKELPQEF